MDMSQTPLFITADTLDPRSFDYVLVAFSAGKESFQGLSSSPKFTPIVMFTIQC
jgi:hypothetical protein